MIEDYLRELRRRGVVDPDVLDEVRAHLEDAAADVGEAEAIARFGDSRVVARSLRRFPRAPLAVALLVGLALGWIDSRPGFDATGITVVALLAGSAAISAWSPRHAWRWALALGGFVPLFELSQGGSPASLVALGFAGAGALVGAALGRSVRSAEL